MLKLIYSIFYYSVFLEEPSEQDCLICYTESIDKKVNINIHNFFIVAVVISDIFILFESQLK